MDNLTEDQNYIFKPIIFLLKICFANNSNEEFESLCRLEKNDIRRVRVPKGEKGFEHKWHVLATVIRHQQREHNGELLAAK